MTQPTEVKEEKCMDDNPSPSNGSFQLKKALNSKLVQQFRDIAVDKGYKRLKSTITDNGINPLKWAASITRFGLHWLFKIIFNIIGSTFGLVALPFGKWNKTREAFEAAGEVFEGLIVMVIDFVVRTLLSPDWWYTSIKIATKHAKKHQNIQFRQSFALVAGESFMVIAERAFRANFGELADIAPISDDDKRKLTDTIEYGILHSPGMLSIHDIIEQDEQKELMQEQLELMPTSPDDTSSFSTNCVVCKEYHADHAIVPCGHMVFCNNNECHQSCNQQCPSCRKPIISIHRIFSMN